MNYRQYIDLNTIYPDDKFESETYYIDSIVLSENEVRLAMARSPYWMVRGLKSNFKYKRLISKGHGVMMSDTPMERRTNCDFLQKANGDVIIFGLGLGLIIVPLLSDIEIKSITVIEIDKSLITMVLPVLKEYDLENKLKITQGDCFTYVPEKDSKFDTIYFDIWIDIVSDFYEEQKSLERKFRKYLNKENPKKYINSWMKDYYKKQIIKEKRASYNYGY